MKTKILSIILLLFLFVSCKESYEKGLSEIAGTWSLQQMSYTDESGEIFRIHDKTLTLSFLDDNLTDTEGDLEKHGIFVVEQQIINFTYEFDFTLNQCHIEVQACDFEKMPEYTFGKVQVYNFKLIDENKLIFEIDTEYNVATEKVFYNPEYIYVR